MLRGICSKQTKHKAVRDFQNILACIGYSYSGFFNSLKHLFKKYNNNSKRCIGKKRFYIWMSHYLSTQFESLALFWFSVEPNSSSSRLTSEELGENILISNTFLRMVVCYLMLSAFELAKCKNDAGCILLSGQPLLAFMKEAQLCKMSRKVFIKTTQL